MIQRKCSLKLSLSIISIILALLSNLPSAYSQEEESEMSETWSLEGHFINLASLCDVPEPKLLPRTFRYPPGELRYTISGCETLDKELDHPLVILIKIQNSTNNNLTLQLPPDLNVYTQTDAEHALAYYFPRRHKMEISGFSMESWLWGWNTKVKGKVETEVISGEAIELLYLVPRFNGKATIELSNIGKFKINAPKQNIPSAIPSDVKAQIEKLHSQNSAERAEGAEQLGQMGNRAILATPYLIEILEDSTQVQKPIKRVDSSGNVFITGLEFSTTNRIAAGALNKITGKDFGENAEKWKKWWEENKQSFHKGR